MTVRKPRAHGGLTKAGHADLPKGVQTPEKRTHSTRQRAAITAVLEQAKGPLTAEEVWKSARRAKPGLGLRTVFRNLQEQVDDMTLLRVVFPGQPPRYEKAAARHHPHFVCHQCGGVFDLPGETPDVRDRCELPAGFEADGCDVTLFGKCADCASKKLKKTRKNA